MATALDLMAARGRMPSRVGLMGALPFDQYRLLAEQVPDVPDLNAVYTGSPSHCLGPQSRRPANPRG